MEPYPPRTDQPPPTLTPDTVTLPPGYIAALDHIGRIVAIPTAPDQPANAATGGPVSTTPPERPAALPPIVGQVVVLGSITALAASGAFWIAAAALRQAHPVLPEAVECLKWAVIFVAVVVAGVFVAKVRSRTGGTTSFSVFNTTRHTTVGRQTVRGRNNRLTNRF
ncbi:hypothetical protein ACFOSC_18130 [Streptantibioticus rubrisoli]|uniref:Integral membrane protein n=1 Tax=Streptantibioticus rubrisoli TaxID=1387313 RepID=A0ABT1PH02_9ACTN|nr:hypothetical protein [Streptantibioticus rubrisoli]MCQ4044647.1 hypothetical protein [Streptantibioticus rubrisoli]